MFHRLDKRVYYHDTDCMGVVYYANYLKYFEEARTEYFAEKGIIMSCLAEKDLFFAVRGVEINYRSPARYGDLITVTSSITGINRTRIMFKQDITRDTHLLVTSATELVCIDSGFKPRLVPSCLTASLNVKEA